MLTSGRLRGEMSLSRFRRSSLIARIRRGGSDLSSLSTINSSLRAQMLHLAEDVPYEEWPDDPAIALEVINNGTQFLSNTGTV